MRPAHFFMFLHARIHADTWWGSAPLSQAGSPPALRQIARSQAYQWVLAATRLVAGSSSSPIAIRRPVLLYYPST